MDCSGAGSCENMAPSPGAFGMSDILGIPPAVGLQVVTDCNEETNPSAAAGLLRSVVNPACESVRPPAA